MIERARKNAKIGKNNAKDADVAQLVEQLIRNEQVTGSSPAIGSIFIALIYCSSSGKLIYSFINPTPESSANLFSNSVNLTYSDT